MFVYILHEQLSNEKLRKSIATKDLIIGFKIQHIIDFLNHESMLNLKSILPLCFNLLSSSGSMVHLSKTELAGNNKATAKKDADVLKSSTELSLISARSSRRREH